MRIITIFKKPTLERTPWGDRCRRALASTALPAPSCTALSRAKSASSCPCWPPTSCRTCRAKAGSCSAAATSHRSTVCGATAHPRAVPRLPTPAARHALTRTMSATAAPWPGKIIRKRNK